jgi:adenine-specific DNA-methyltransferase
LSKDRFNEFVNDGRIWFGADGSSVPSIKRFLTEVKDSVTPMTIWKYTDVGHSQDAAQKLKKLFDGAAYFDYPKSVDLIKRCIELYTSDQDIILDFFAGSATTAQAVLELNAENNTQRKFIMVQLDEPCDVKSEAYKAGFKNISAISKERIRRAGLKIKKENELLSEGLDCGFRALKIDTSNLTDVYYNPDAVAQDLLSDQADNVKADRSPEDLLFQVLLDWGVDLSLPIKKETIQGKTVYLVDQNALAACFDGNGGITEDFVKELAKKQPLRVVFRDAGFKSDSVKINVEQIFKLVSPGTEVKCI